MKKVGLIIFVSMLSMALMGCGKEEAPKKKDPVENVSKEEPKKQNEEVKKEEQKQKEESKDNTKDNKTEVVPKDPVKKQEQVSEKPVKPTKPTTPVKPAKPTEKPAVPVKPTAKPAVPPKQTKPTVPTKPVNTVKPILNGFGAKETKLWKAEVTYKGNQKIKKFIGDGTEPGSIFHVKITYKGDMSKIKKDKNFSIYIGYDGDSLTGRSFPVKEFKGNVVEKDITMSATSLKNPNINLSTEFVETNIEEELNITLKSK